MKNTILVAGATGNLGGEIAKALIRNGAHVRAIVRSQSDYKKIDDLRNFGIEIIEVDMDNEQELTQACAGVSCVVSAVAGLREVIVDFQSRLASAAVAAGVPRFIPSDFSTDFTQIKSGLNRNFDLRKEFRELLDKLPLQATSIFNGAFAYILKYNLPLFNRKDGTVTYYDDKQDFTIDFSTVEDTASFTALVALDQEAPRDLRIASFSPSPYDFVILGRKFTTKDFGLVYGGSLQAFADAIKARRIANPQGEQQLYADWQQMQYQHNMFLAHHEQLDNSRYPNQSWMSAEKFIQQL